MNQQHAAHGFRALPAIAVLALGVALSAWGMRADAQTATTTGTSSAPSCTLSVSPTSISAGESASLSWTSQGVTTGSLDQGLGTVASASGGSMTVSPQVSTTYTGTFAGTSGTVSCSATLTVSGTGSMMATSSTSTVSATSSMTGSSTVITAPNYYYGATSTAGGTYYGTPSTGIGSMGTTAQGTGTTGTGTTGTGTATGMGTGTVGMTPLAALTAYPAAGTTPAPMVVDIDSSGTALVRGVVMSSSANMVTLQSWGGLWIIRSTGTATVIPAGATVGDLSQIRVGDFIGVDGTLATDQLYTIDANLVRDWTTNPYVATSAAAESTGGTTGAATGTDEMSSGTSSAGTTASSALYTGVASSIGTDSFTLTADDGTAYTVATDADTLIWDQTGNTIPFSSIQSGDSIRLNGTLDSAGTIKATVVRDTSVGGAGAGASSGAGGSSATSTGTGTGTGTSGGSGTGGTDTTTSSGGLPFF